MFLVFFLYFLYATIFVIGKFAITISQPIFLTGARMTSAGIVSYIIHHRWYKTPQFKLLKKTDWFVLIMLAFFNVYMTNAWEFWSLQYMSAGKTSFIYNCSPFFVLLLSSVFFAEEITWKKFLGMMIGFLALIPMLLGDCEVLDTTRHFGPLSVADFVMLGAAFATSLGWVLMKHFINKRVLTPYFLNGVSLFIGGLMCFAHSFLFESRPFIMTDNISQFLWYMTIMMLIQNVGAYNLQTELMHHYSATLITLFSFIMPLFTVVLGWIFLNEPITPMFFICSAGVAVGLLIFYLDELSSSKKA